MNVQCLIIVYLATCLSIVELKDKHPIQFEVVYFRGTLSIVGFIHNIEPGSLKTHTRIVSVHKVDELASQASHPPFPGYRRWLPKSEIPYPGYCRGPSSRICEAVLCNCAKLKEIWHKLKHDNAELLSGIKVKKSTPSSIHFKEKLSVTK